MFEKYRYTILVSLAVIVISLLLFWAAQAAGKTLWEYLEILIIPAVLGAIALLFNRAARKRDREIESDRQRQATLATYFDRMSDLLINHNLRKSKKGSEARTVAKARTISALRNLDGKRIAQVIQFLTESNLGGDKLLTIELPEADLQKVDLRGADLQGANLKGAKLQGANLNEAKLQGAYLWGANLQGAILYEANLQGAILRGANLQGVILWDANLQEADLGGANLQGAGLEEALVLATQLDEASSLENATMPDGTKYEEWIAKGKPDWSKGTAKKRTDDPEENDSESEDEA